VADPGPKIFWAGSPRARHLRILFEMRGVFIRLIPGAMATENLPLKKSMAGVDPEEEGRKEEIAPSHAL